MIVPGADGEFGVFAKHAPFMSSLLPGILVVKDGSEESRIFVRGGFADVTSTGLTVLAEQAIPTENLNGDVLEAEKATAAADLEAATTAEQTQAAERAVAVLANF